MRSARSRSKGPGAGGIETASAVVADMVSVVGTTGTGFLQNDPVWRTLERLPPGELASPFYLRLEVEDRAGVLARIAQELASESVSVAQLVQQQAEGRAVLHVVTHEAASGRVDAALAAIRALPEARGEATAMPVDLGSRRRGARLGMTIALIDRFRAVLPVSEATPVISLGEGSTPLLRAPRLSERLGVEIWLKWEASNPTGSYKDRGMTVAVSKAAEDGAEAVICASTGNTAASAAAYAARAGIPAVVLTPEGAVAGAEGGADADARREGARGAGRLRRGARRSAGALPARHARPRQLRQPLSPRGPEDRRLRDRRGARRGARRVRDPLRGRRQHVRLRDRDRRARDHDARSTRSRPSIARRRSPLRSGSATRCTRRACSAAGANVVTVSDDEIVAAWLELATVEGLFCEPSSAAGLAAIRRGEVRGERVVVTITGHGLKDTEAADRYAPPLAQVDADPDAIAAAARRMTVVRAPATSANIGAGFDTAAVALDLWNELEVTDGTGVIVEGEGASELSLDADQPRRPRVRASRRSGGKAASGSGTRFRSSAGSARRRPRSRSGSWPQRPTRAPRSCSPAGLTLEPHADNLGAALLGGLTLAWDGKIARIAERSRSTPIAIIPS